MYELSNCFRALSEPLRLRIIQLLLKGQKEAYGDEIAQSLGIPAYQLSRHLKILKNAGLVKERKEGRWVYFSIAKEKAYLFHSVRPLLARAKTPGTLKPKRTFRAPKQNNLNGRPRTQRQALPDQTVQNNAERQTVKENEFNWNEGPAIPGVL